MKNLKYLVVFLGLFLNTGIANAGNLFDDVYNSDPVTESLDYLMNAGVVEGYSDGTFRPRNLINRAEFTKMVVEGVMGLTPDADVYANCFKDVAEDWYAKYVCYAKEEGLVEGYSGNLFGAEDKIMRSEAVKILDEAYDWESLGTLSYSRFADNQDSTAWYFEYLLMAEERNLFDKLDSYLSPNELISRSQMSELLYRAMNYENGSPVAVRELSDDELSYEEVLDTGILPAYPSNMDFPAHSQSGWSYGCYTFAIKNLVEFKYGTVINVAELQNRIGWDGAFIWDQDEASSFAREYDMDLIFTYNASAEYFFKKLSLGQPMVLYIPYYIGSDNVGHQVVAYSFDENGVWIADSLGEGLQREISFSDIFVDGATYTINITDSRQVKDGGEYKAQFVN
ncbi:MAG: S-layer homology domain-containing protein [Candidatus Gracilibacteria bacterium]